MFNGAKTLVMASSFDAYNSGSDSEGNYKQYHIHGRVGTGFSSSSDYLEGFSRNNSTKYYDNIYGEIEVSPTFYATTDFEDFNYVDLKWMLVFPSPLFAANGIPQVTVTEKDEKHGIRLYKGSHEYTKAYKGSTLMWDVNDDATRLFMTSFYRHLAAGKDKHEALRQAQTDMRHYDNGSYDAPRYWAAFILLE